MFAADIIWLRLIADGRPSLLNLQASIAFAGPCLAAVTILAFTYLVGKKKVHAAETAR